MVSTKILQLINIFSKQAGSLRSDMADRIMYSTIPYFNKERARSVDVPAMERAISGAKKLIYLGTLVCVDEGKHYNGKKSKIPAKATIPDVVDKTTLRLFVPILTHLEKIFQDAENWDPAFGGKAWEKITKSIKGLAIAYQKYLNETDYNKKIELGKMVIVYMNALDGLAHNTGSLYGKLVDEELEQDQSGLDYYDEYSNIFRLMNSKELENPQDVVEEVENELELPIVYKDYLSTARQQKLKDPTNLLSQEQRKEYLDFVTLKKKTRQEFELNISRINELKIDNNEEPEPVALVIEELNNYIDYTISAINLYLAKLSKQSNKQNYQNINNSFRQLIGIKNSLGLMYNKDYAELTVVLIYADKVIEQIKYILENL